MNAHPAATLACRFALGVAGLRDMLIAHLVRTETAQPFLIFLWFRLRRLHRRLATLAAQLALGLPLSPPPRAEPSSLSDRPSPAKATRYLPTTKGWLFDLDIRFAAYTEYFRDLLAQPEMESLLDAAPHLRRQLRSVLRPLTANLPPILALPPRPPRPRPATPPAPRRAPPPRLWTRSETDRLLDVWRPGPIRAHWNTGPPTG
jgi:hypothetical protein